MSLKARLGLTSQTHARDATTLMAFGLANNPFPAASQTSGHPRLTNAADKKVEARLKEFLDNYSSQVLVIEGTQGTGKTNLLQYYDQELPTLDEGDGGVFVVHYYPDPEPALDKLLAQIVQSLGAEYMMHLVEKLRDCEESSLEKTLAAIRGPEFRQMLRHLRELDEEEVPEASVLAIEWLRGMRTYKRHTEALRVYQRLDTTESRIGALRDLLTVSERLGIFRALFLLLDELEKQDDVSRSSIYIVRYLASLRALIDALPRRFFLVLAITPAARSTYSRYYPALASRFEGSIIQLRTIDTLDAAQNLYNFYMDAERRRTIKEHGRTSTAKPKEPLTTDALEDLYKVASFDAQKTGGKLTARAWLQRLHERFAGMVELASVPA